jgi:hypothetical protein
LSLGRSHKVIGRKALALVVVLILSVVAFVVFAGEARAQQQSTEVKQSIVISNGEAIEPVGEPLPDEIPQPNLAPGPVSEPLPEQASGVLLEQAPGAVSILESSGPSVGPAPLAEDAGAELVSKLEVPPSQVDPVASEPVVFEENKALSPRAEEGPSTDSPGDAWPTPLPEKGPANSTPIEPSSSAVYWQPAASGPTAPVLVRGGSHPPSSLEAAASGAVETLRSAANTGAGVLGAVSSPDSSSAGTKEHPSKDAPQQPSSPLAPLVGGISFSSSGGGQVGSAGGVAPLLLLLCVLVSGSILLRRDGKLSWAFCEPPKLSSALFLLPLERPG